MCVAGYWFWQAFVQAQHSLLFPLLPINGHKMIQSRDSAPLENIYKGKTKQHATLFELQNWWARSSQDLLHFLRFIKILELNRKLNWAKYHGVLCYRKYKMYADV